MRRIALSHWTDPLQASYRLSSPADFHRIYAIEVACFQPPFRFTRRYLHSLMEQPHSATWVAEVEGSMAGFAIVEWTCEEDETLAYIPTLEVLPSWRKRGIGRELLSRLEASARQAGAGILWLNVDATNSGAIRLYEASGFHCRGRQENYYPHGRAALVYSKPL